MKRNIVNIVILGLSIFLGIAKGLTQIPLGKNQIDATNKRQGDWVVKFNSDWDEVTETDKAIYYRLISYEFISQN